MKINHIYIKHPNLGEIIIHGEISKEIEEQIGDVTNDYSKTPIYYHAQITKNENETFNIKDFRVIKPEGLNIGTMNNSKGNKTFITVITNKKAGNEITIYPSAVLSVEYNFG